MGHSDSKGTRGPLRPPVSFLVGAAVLLVVGAFVWGAVAVKFGVFPGAAVDRILETARDWNQPQHSQTHFLHPARHPESGVTVRKPDRMAPGLTLLTGLWNGGAGFRPELRLVDDRGQVLHRWRIRPRQIWSESPHDDPATGRLQNIRNYVHGAHLTPEGDVVFNVEYLGLVRMDACGEVEWRLPYRTHHSVHRADDGNFWVFGIEWVEQKTAAPWSKALEVPYIEDHILEVSPQGEILTNISVLEILFESDYRYLFPKYGADDFRYDPTHGNDVETLPAGWAGRFPFEEGDIMFSLRRLNSVFVIDRDNHRVKFHLEQRLSGQHDPDFLRSGRISIFNNRTCKKEGACEWTANWAGSEIMTVDPRTRGLRVPIRGGETHDFYTATAGKHQVLPNGNVLVAETNAGRVFEVDRNGDIVWEWHHPGTEDGREVEVLGATRYELDERNVEAWACED